MDQTADRRPEWLKRKHGRQRSDPYAELLAGAPRCNLTPAIRFESSSGENP
jgi:hypothetical protein